MTTPNLEWLLLDRRREVALREEELVQGFNAFLEGVDGGDARFSKAVDQLDAAKSDLARLEAEWTRASEMTRTAIFMCADGTRLTGRSGDLLEFEVGTEARWIEFLDWRDPRFAAWEEKHRTTTTEAPPLVSIPEIPRRRFKFQKIVAGTHRVFVEE